MGDIWTEAGLVRIERPRPDLVRLVLHLTGCWPGTGKADEAVRLQVATADGEWAPARWYSIRKILPGQDRTEVWIDVVQHPGGVVSDWSRAATPGARVRWNGLHGWYDPPVQARTFLLVADPPGVPAAQRILEELPRDVRVRTLFTARDDDLASRVRDQLGTHPADYVWVATASVPARRIRALLRHELHRSKETYSVLAYWIPDREGHRRKLVESGLDLAVLWERAQADGLDEEVALDQIAETLEAHGL